MPGLVEYGFELGGGGNQLLLGLLARADVGNRRHKPDDLPVGVKLRRIRAMHEALADGRIRNFDFELDRFATQRGFDVSAETAVSLLADDFGNGLPIQSSGVKPNLPA